MYRWQKWTQFFHKGFSCVPRNRGCSKLVPTYLKLILIKNSQKVLRDQLIQAWNKVAKLSYSCTMDTAILTPGQKETASHLLGNAPPPLSLDWPAGTGPTSLNRRFYLHWWLGFELHLSWVLQPETGGKRKTRRLWLKDCKMVAVCYIPLNSVIKQC